MHTVTYHVTITENTFNSTDHELIPKILQCFHKLRLSQRWQESSAQEQFPRQRTSSSSFKKLRKTQEILECDVRRTDVEANYANRRKNRRRIPFNRLCVGEKPGAGGWGQGCERGRRRAEGKKEGHRGVRGVRGLEEEGSHRVTARMVLMTGTGAGGVVPFPIPSVTQLPSRRARTHAYKAIHTTDIQAQEYTLKETDTNKYRGHAPSTNAFPTPHSHGRYYHYSPLLNYYTFFHPLFTSILIISLAYTRRDAERKQIEIENIHCKTSMTQPVSEWLTGEGRQRERDCIVFIDR